MYNYAYVQKLKKRSYIDNKNQNLIILKKKNKYGFKF